MKQSSILYLKILLLAFFTQSCREVQKDNSVSFNLESLFENKKAFKLSEFVKNIEYVRLETNNDIVLGDNNVQVLPTDEYLYILQADRPLSIFKRDGKFIRTIGLIGRGPGEYSENYTFSLDEINQRIFILNKQKGTILIFTSDGKYISEIPLQQKIIEFEYLDNDMFCACIRTEGTPDHENFNYLSFNINGEIHQKYFIPGSAYREFSVEGSSLPYGMQLTPYFATSPSGVTIQTMQNDSVFNVSSNGNIYPILTWNLGKYKAPFFSMDPRISKEEKSKYVTSMGVVETEKYWYIGFRLGNDFFKAILDKASNKSYMVDNFKGALINDFDGGPIFWPFFESNKGKYFAHAYSPMYLKKGLEEGKYNLENIKYPDENIKLKSLINSLELTDNYVIRIIELKY